MKIRKGGVLGILGACLILGLTLGIGVGSGAGVPAAQAAPWVWEVTPPPPVLALPESEIPFPLVVSQRLEPEEIFLYGSDRSPQTASLEIELSYPPAPLRPLDLVLILDTSASVHLREIQALGLQAISHLQEADRVALIATGGQAELLLGFTNEFSAARERIEDLYPQGGNRLYEALRLAIEELVHHGRPDTLKAIVVTGNGLDAMAAPAQLLALAEEARLQNIQIFPVGTAPYVDWVTLDRLALITRGTFFRRFDARTTFQLFRLWEREVIPPHAITLTLSLPPYILYLGAEGNPPDEVRVRGPLGTTLLRWVIPKLGAGETWKTRLVLAATKGGRVRVFSPVWRSRVGLFVEGVYGPVWKEQILPMPRLTVLTPPVAYFRVVPQIPLVGEAVHFEDLSFDPDGEIVSWRWYFGDGSMSQERNPVHRYETPGRYLVMLVVTDRDGATALVSQEIEVREPLPPPPPTQEALCRRAVWALLASELQAQGWDHQAQEALKRALLGPTVRPEVAEAVRSWMEFLRETERWTAEVIQRAYEHLLDVLEALGSEAVPSKGERASLALAVLVRIVHTWPELRASCR